MQTRVYFNFIISAFYRALFILNTKLVTSGTPFVNLIVTGSEIRLEKESVRVT
jgi:hypothetical protein